VRSRQLESVVLLLLQDKNLACHRRHAQKLLVSPLLRKMVRNLLLRGASPTSLRLKMPAEILRQKREAARCQSNLTKGPLLAKNKTTTNLPHKKRRNEFERKTHRQGTTYTQIKTYKLNPFLSVSWQLAKAFLRDLRVAKSLIFLQGKLWLTLLSSCLNSKSALLFAGYETKNW